MYNAIIVDDEPRAIDALKENIDWKSCGIRKVYTASNMASAIQTIQKAQIEIMICDIEMPNGDGTQLLEWLRENQMNVNCIFMTCHQEYSIMRKAIQLKCYDYVLKPIIYEEFSQLLLEMVHKMEQWEMMDRKEKPANWGELMDSNILQKNQESTRNIEMEVKRYIKEHMADNISISDIAENLHFNPNYLMRVFKNKTEMSILEYIVKVRMEAAKKILKGTRLPVREISYMVGYTDCVYFTKVFHKEIGVTPTQFRKNL